MLELKELTKTYKPKKGVPVNALHGVSLSFEEKGLVFILGRSGSGKSTLLNIVGGLDSADDGEIIIYGRSSKDFKTLDYDAYRNEYIGFIFQEYNLLDEFTVGENIMLALQLQGQKADKQRLESILREVDLEGYADRKPNELSGGQRQRVTIARALVKNPKIIMADEPTGALDEETGRQVLETLKKMSKNKLVIVVSHDREFAEEYADRIIRLKDGKVSSDTANKNENIEINEITATGEKKATEQTRSHLPYLYALKMGLSGLMTKPLRLIITIILCMVSFAAFGAVDTFNAFNAAKVSLNVYADSNCEASAYTANILSSVNGEMRDTGGASNKDIKRLKQKTGVDYVGVTNKDYRYREGYTLSLLSNENLDGKNNSPYYTQTLYGYHPASAEFFDKMGFVLTGNLPQAVNEIIITKYIFDQINLGGINMFDKKTESEKDKYEPVTVLPDSLRTEQTLISKKLYIRLGDEYRKIVGVIDTHADRNRKFDSLKPSQEYNYDRQRLLEEECRDYFKYGYHSLGYISQDSYDTIVKSHSAHLDNWDTFWGIPAKGTFNISRGSNDISNSFFGIAEDKDLNKVKDLIWLDGKERTSLNDSEIVIGLNTAFDLLKDSDSIERDLYYTHNKTYFDGIISFDKMSFYDLYNEQDTGYENVAKFIVFFEEAEKASDSGINAFKNYISQKVVEHGNIPIDELYHKIENFGYYTNNYVKVKEEFIEKDFEKLEEKHWRMMYASYLMSIGQRFYYSPNGSMDNMVLFEMDGGYNDNAMGGRNGKELDNIDAKAFYITQKLKTLDEQKVIKSSASYRFNYFDGYYKDIKDSNIVGIYVPQNGFLEFNKWIDTIVFNNAMYREAKNVEIEPYCFLLAPMPTDRNQLKKLVDVHYEDGSRVLQMHNGVVTALDLVQRPIKQMSGLILLIGLGLAAFSIMMLGNYIGTSIADKKRDIGTLRALGAKASDVFAIFVTESIIIAMFNSVLSIIVSVFLCGALNNMIKNQTQVSFSALNFGIRQVAIMIIINIAIAIIASLIPIYKMSKKKPIDCIRDR